MTDMDKTVDKCEVILVHDHDEAGIRAHLARGCRIVGWVDGFYRFLAKEVAHERGKRAED